ncbi:MAG: response regulator [Gemmatimonadetes bacterium]|nr:MAG: response regulator [Gemmatimonadota bacterium]
MTPPRILVVDDEKRIVELIRYQLEENGYRVEEAYDGEMALEKAKRLKPDLIILDLMIPKRDGIEVCEELKTHREYNPIPIIMLTARSKEEDRIQGYRVGADRYLTKPFNLEDLAETVETVLAEKKREREQDQISEKVSFTLQSRIECMRQVNQIVSRLYRETRLSEEEVMNVDFALMELMQNAIEHGNKSDQNRLVKFGYTLYPDRVEFTIEDEGEGFRADQANHGDVILKKLLKGEKNIPEIERRKRPGGLGIYLAKMMVDKIEYNERGNRAVLTKYLPPNPQDTQS